MTEFDFSRQRRLLTAGDYRWVFDKAAFKVSDQHLLILARPAQSPHSRLGLVIAKNTSNTPLIAIALSVFCGNHFVLWNNL